MFARACMPPSTRTLSPVIHPDACLEARKHVKFAQSSTLPSRPSGRCGSHISLTPGPANAAAVRSTGTTPGAIALTRMPIGASSQAIVAVRLSSPAWEPWEEGSVTAVNGVSDAVGVQLAGAQRHMAPLAAPEGDAREARRPRTRRALRAAFQGGRQRHATNEDPLAHGVWRSRSGREGIAVRETDGQMSIA